MFEMRGVRYWHKAEPFRHSACPLLGVKADNPDPPFGVC
jgi:hypothetical protein